ncbi:MAG: GspE/PulE family protein [Candidatus Omnitrophica bacterium]|nr:GspE/PulE family protein [Candidatus Omnitrophota bacterium]MDD3988275.1 GspE/PulE family protein [Candidatus Omnitrophota bacterium]MDD4981845.1 GspE/PulE family protein [Candidatus Omnitrophota bacterium]MDD5665619.1 GspE/PulE family protein [Candidatus Omnitrophota bacterium]
MQTLKDKIIEILVKGGHLNNDQLNKALNIQREKGTPLRKVLVEEDMIPEEVLLSLLSEELYIPTLNLSKYKFPAEIIGLVPEHIARLYNLIPISRFGNTITVAVSDPLNIFALDDLKTLTGCNIDIVLSPDEEIMRSIESQYGSGSKDMEQILDDASQQTQDDKSGVELVRQEEIELSNALEESGKAPIVKLVDLMLNQALKKRASDIHIEPEQGCLRIRYRIDGALHDVFKIPKTKQNAILARLKIISNLDITENRIPQDGRFKVRFEGKEVDFRVSGLPTTFGQKFVLRALDKGNLSIGLDKLGFSEQPERIFKEAISKPFGMILVTGPTGSGKSTTLYSVLNQMNTPEKNIITIEDPVEYQVEGITQIQVKPDIGLDFSSGLRSLLRQSPDVIMIGEIRDSETADIAIKAALTGQIVLSTLHTNDAISSITRLIDMGVEPFLVASSVVMLCAQRLARKLCLKCRKPINIPEDFLKKIGFTEKAVFYTAVGCKYCNNTGFYGRVAILEAVLINDAIREMIIEKKPLDMIKKYAQDQGMRTLRDDAFLKVRQEVTTLDEAIRITTEE